MSKTAARIARLGKPMALAAIAVGTFAGHAQAQTNVTIYGRVVAGVDYQTNVAKADGSTGSLLRGAGNQWGTSMIGFKGTEELGGGLKSFFLLESGFDATKGATNGTALFNRRSYVGLDGSAGSIKVGKNLFIDNDIWFLDPTGQQFISTANLVHGRNWQGANNVIEYVSPTWGGFNATLQTSLGEQPGSASNGRKDGVSLAYVQPTFELRAIYDLARDVNGKYGSVLSTGAPGNIYDSSKELILGGTLTIDAWKLFAGYENLRAPDVAAGTPDRLNHYWLGTNYQVTPMMTLIGAVYHVNVDNNGGNANLFMLGANYNLSKRTLLYASIGAVNNSGNANFSVEASDNTPPAGQNQRGGYFGIAHSF